MPRLHLTFMIVLLSTAASCTAGPDPGSTDAAPSGPGARDAETPVVGTLWQWMGTITPVERIDVMDPSRYTLRLRNDGNAELRFDCNRGSGSYSMTEHELSFGLFASTRMACPEDSQDIVFMGQLEKVSSYFTRDGELYLEMPYDSGTMRFVRASAQD